MLSFFMTVLVGAAVAAPPDAFDGSEHLGVSAMVGNVALADLDGDGRLDLVVANHGLSVRRGRADDTFGPEERIVTFDHAPFSRVAVDDINRDGVPDLAFCTNTPVVALWIGTGDGTFVAGAEIETPGSPHLLAFGDVNGDGVTDLVTANRTFRMPGNDSFGDAPPPPPNGVTILHGTADGTFEVASSHSIDAWPACLVVHDVNADGCADIVVSHQHPNLVRRFLGHRTESPTELEPITVGDGPGALAIADLNDDGHADLIVGNGGGDVTIERRSSPGRGSANILFGASDGTFTDGGAHSIPFPVTAIVATDLNGDGVPDLATSLHEGFGASVSLGIGDGTFHPAQTYPAGRNPCAIVVGDVNLDDVPDLIVGNELSNDVTCLRGRGDGTFVTRQMKHLIPTGKGYGAVASGDVNGDGRLDFVRSGRPASDLAILLGTPAGTLRAAPRVPLPSSAEHVALGDLNGDGHLDVIASLSQRRTTLLPLLGTGNGTFRATDQFEVVLLPNAQRHQPQGRIIDLAFANLNGDAHADLVIVGTDVRNQNGRLLRLLGNGDGTFTPTRFDPVGGSPRHLRLSDVNQDGAIDVILAHDERRSSGRNGGAHPPGLTVWIGHGDGAFNAPLTINTSGRLNDLVAADLNRDSIPDLAMVIQHRGSAQIDVRFGTGDGRFGPPITVTNEGHPWNVAVGDVDGDAQPDLFVGSITGTMTLFRGDGRGSFTEYDRDHVLGGSAITIVVHDIDADGADDVVWFSARSEYAVLLLNGRAGNR